MEPFHCMILTPSTGTCKMGYTASLYRLLTYFSQVRVYQDEPTQYLEFDTCGGSGISANRERLIKWNIKNEKISHFLFIDEDMTFDPRALHILANRKLDIVGCTYPHRMAGKGFTALAANKKERIELTEDSEGVVECCYTGFGFCLITRKVFETLPKPWFLMGYNLENEIYSTEDASLAHVLETEGYPFKWHCDLEASKLIGHIGQHEFKWKEAHNECVR